MEDKELAFGQKQAEHYDNWFLTPEGKYTDKREKDLLVRLMKPEAGQTLLDVGCGTGNYLLFFEELGYKVTGLDPSPAMMKYIADKMQKKPQALQAVSEALPFRDNSYDVVALITSFEFVKEAQKGVEEALRVARKKVVFGILNKTSCKNIWRRLRAKRKQSVFLKIRFYSVREMKRLIKAAAKGMPLKLDWGTVLTLPFCWVGPLRCLDRLFSFWKNPFGSFLGMAVELPEKKKKIEHQVACQFSIYPLGKTDLGDVIHKALKELKKRGLSYEVGGMSTTFSGDADTVFECLQAMFDIAAKHGGVVLTTTVSNACKLK